MANYQESRVKLTNKQLKKWKSAGKNKTGTIIRLCKKIFQDEELLHESFLTTKQTTKRINVFANIMSTDIKFSKVQSNGSFGSWFGNLGKKELTNIAISLGRDNLHGFVSSLTSNTINIFKRSLSGKGAVRAEK